MLAASALALCMSALQAFAANEVVVNTAAELEALVEPSDTVVQYGDLQFDTATGTIVGCDYEAEGALAIPETIEGVPVTAIGKEAFGGCEVLEDIYLPSSVTTIGIAAFLDCCWLRTIEIPSGVTTIGSEAFANCKSLTTINIPRSVITIGESVFSGCSVLSSITVDADNAIYASDESGVLFSKDKTELICYPVGKSVSTYAIPSGVKVIGNSAFEGCDFFTAVEIPGSVTEIKPFAFGYCSGLAGFTVDAANPAYSTDEYGVLFNKSKTELVRFPRGNAASIYVIPNGVTAIGEYAFFSCDNLREINLPNSIAEIGSGAFASCYWLKTINLPSGITELRNNTFSGCETLQELELPSSVTAIGEYAFSECWRLKTINLPSGVQSIGKGAFNDCEKLRTIRIPNGITTIEADTFRDCYALSEFIIPSSVTMIGKSAFRTLNRIDDLYYGGSKEQWDAIANDGYNGAFAYTAFHYNSHLAVPESRWASVRITDVTADQVSGNAVVRVALTSNADIATSGLLTVAVYDQGGEMRDFTMVEAKLEALGSLETDIALGCAVSESDTVKAFYWGGSMRPVAQACVLMTPNV